MAIDTSREAHTFCGVIAPRVTPVQIGVTIYAATLRGEGSNAVSAHDAQPRSDLVVVEADGPVEGARLLPDEASALGRVVNARRLEFTLGRHCAHVALGVLGFDVSPVLVGPARMPVWPDGVVGSITHGAGRCLAAVARRSCVSAIGIDTEVHAPLPDMIIEQVASEGERQHLASLRTDVCWDCLLFSVKESVYKAWFPMARRWLSFQDVTVRFDPEARSFRAKVPPPDRSSDPDAAVIFTGAFEVTKARVFTAVVVPVSGEVHGAAFNENENHE